MQIYPDSILIILQRINVFAHFWRILYAKWHLLNFVWSFDYIFDVLDKIIGKIIESRYIGICPIIDKIIDIGRRLPQIIGNFRDLSAKLSISKMTGELSKIYRYRKIWLIAHPYLQPLRLVKKHTFPVFCAGCDGCITKYNFLEEPFSHCVKKVLFGTHIFSK